MTTHNPKFDLILDTITDGVLVVDSQGVVLYANQAAEILLARSPIIGQSLAIPVNPDKNSYQDINLIRPNGLVWAEMRSSPLEWDGQPGYVIALRDITERKHMELERQKFVSLADNSMEFIGMFDMKFLPFYINEAGMRLIGLDSLEQCIRTPVQEFFFPEDQRFILDEFFPRVVREGHADVEIRFRHFKSGAAIWMLYNVFFIKDSAGEPVGIATVSRDISARKQAEAALHEADRRKDEFLAMLAHELRNPLAPISNAAHILDMLKLEDPRLSWAKEIIKRQVMHLTHLVDDLLDISRIARGKISLKKERLDLVEVIKSVLDTARGPILAKQQHLDVHLPEQPILLEGDSVRLSQVLLNLLDNAGKYSLENAQIEVDVQLYGTEVEIQVRDNGTGISAGLLPTIFDLFQQGARTLDRSQGGLGIGLTLVKRLVELHGGKVTASSPGAGLGSTFSIRLPTIAEAAGFPAAETPTPSPNAGMRVLVVDDDADVRESTALLLELNGYEVKMADSGAHAITLIEAFHPDVVLLDIGMPVENGYQVAQRIRKLPNGGDLLLVALSGYGRAEELARSQEAGFDHHLIKPLNFNTLRDLLSEWEVRLGRRVADSRLFDPKCANKLN
ncbi:hybrid sensor histidine kinase/response regulator [Methylobacter tundripaludum]|uniref:histidine kinase n=1 Tax=Methylobacter tundripaludum (strain ATCC BAA-1195 / DSM 17260 / SV96) TaxID=697282 RepID=G3ITZ0_METTV|nr:ATP-binding protein [Methylobacter tundripaludum]EGW21473.1 PAS/PAC sensor hybrid histidine kinase [Methylobacter tundripaludum SV96]